MKRLVGLEKELAKLLDPRPPRPRRKPLSQAAVQARVLEGCFEYLATITHPREVPKAQALIAELEALPSERLAQSILTSMENLLVERHPRGQSIFTTLRKLAPERLGRGYAMYRMFQDPGMVVEELFEDYVEYYL